MADAKATELNAITDISADDLLYVVDDPGGTPVSKKITAGNVKKYMAGIDWENPVAVTGAATITIGKHHVCTGTTADYTVTLPAVSGNAGKLISVEMSAALTKMVTVDGNAAETIDTELTRVMHDKETAILLCNGTTWTKVAGKTLPMSFSVNLTASVALTDSAYTKVTYNQELYDVGGVFDIVTTNSFIPRRSSKWDISVVSQIGVSSGTNYPDGAIARLYVNDAGTRYGSFLNTIEGTIAGTSISVARLCISAVAASAYDMRIYTVRGANSIAIGSNSSDNCFFEGRELVEW